MSQLSHAVGVHDKSTRADFSGGSDYWDAKPTSNKSTYRGSTMAEWQNEVNKTGLALLPAPVGPGYARTQAVTIPTGRKRPGGEHPSPVPHQSHMTIRNNPISPERMGFAAANLDVNSGFERLLRLLRAVEPTGSEHGRLLPTDVLRAAQGAKLPIDDREVMVAMRRCQPDALGKIAISELMARLRSHHEARGQNFTARRLWDPPSPRPKGAPLPKVESWSQPPLPSHAYRASDAPNAPPPARAQRAPRMELERMPWHERQCFELLPSGNNVVPHRTASQQSRLLADTARGREASIAALELALNMQDRTHCGVMPFSTVSAFAKLHHVCGGMQGLTHAEWDAQLRAHEIKNMPRRVDYRALLRGLRTGC